MGRACSCGRHCNECILGRIRRRTGHGNQLFVATSNEVGKGNSSAHAEQAWILRTEIHSAGNADNCVVGFTEPGLYPATEQPCPGQIWIECHAFFNQGIASLQFSRHEGQRNARRAERHGIIRTKLYSPAREPLSLDDLKRPVNNPATGLALRIAAGCHSVR